PLRPRPRRLAPGLAGPGPGRARGAVAPPSRNRSPGAGGDGRGPAALSRGAGSTERMTTPPLRIGTRGSPLALWQAHHIAGLLRPLIVPRPVELVEIQTAGDVIRDKSLVQIGGEGLFTKEIQRALLNGSADVAVHSLKDLPTI